MEFSLTEEQTALRDLARQILEDQVTVEDLREIEQQPERFDRKTWGMLAEANLLGLAIPESYGGMGFGFFEISLLLEEIGRSVAPLPVLPTLVLGALAITEFGSEAQKKAWLPSVVRGEAILSAALTQETPEPFAPLETYATKHEGGWRVDGLVTSVPVADLAERILVPASCGSEVGIFLLDPRVEGVTLERLETTNGEPQFRITLNAAEVGVGDRLGDLEHGREILEWIRQRAVTAYAAIQVGVSEKALRITAQYTSERKQFDRPVATFQAVGQRAANCYIDVECQRLPVQQAAWRLSERLEAATEVAIAKYWAGETGHRVSYASQHLHGGIGVDLDYPLHRYCLWSKQIELTLGSSTHQLLNLGARLAAETP